MEFEIFFFPPTQYLSINTPCPLMKTFLTTIRTKIITLLNPMVSLGTLHYNCPPEDPEEGEEFLL
jgi:hypothetical protein